MLDDAQAAEQGQGGCSITADPGPSSGRAWLLLALLLAVHLLAVARMRAVRC